MDTKCGEGITREKQPEDMQRQRQGQQPSEAKAAWDSMPAREMTAQEFIDSKIRWHKEQVNQLERAKHKIPPALTLSDLLTLARNI